MDARGMTVLLVGKGARNTPILEDHLRKRGCDICFATTRKQATEILQRHRFDVVLSEFMLPDGSAYQLMALLRDTETTMFFSNSVEEGCWWMTALFKGQDRSEEAGMRPAEFRIRLDEILCGKLSRKMNNPQGSVTDRVKDVRLGFGNQTAGSAQIHEPAPRPSRASVGTVMGIHDRK